MKIIHMSDLHLTGDGGPVWGEDSRRKFLFTIEAIGKIKNIDLVVVSGDISDDGSLSSYVFADQVFAKLNIPTYWCVGNHDNIDTISTIFQPSFCHIVDQTLINGWRLYFVNSVALDADNPQSNRSRGVVTTQTRKCLNKQLSLHSEPSIIILHHPPLEIDGWQDDKILKDRETFRAMLNKHENVKIVLSGHVHIFSKKSDKGILYSTASSVAFAFSSELPKFTIEHGHEGFSCISINKNDVLIENIIIGTEK